MAKDDLVMFSHEFDGVEHLIAKDQFGIERDFIRPNNIMVISENNTYPVKDCKEVDVQLPEQKAAKLQIAENGEFTPDTYSGEYYDEVTVQMATELTDEEITITENGTYKPSTGKMFSKVTVDVPCDTMVGYDEWGNPVTPYVDPTTGKLEIDVLPDKIKVTVLPTKTTYNLNEYLDYTGIEVRAYTKDDRIWNRHGYNNGIIPFNELILESINVDELGENNNGFPEQIDGGDSVIDYKIDYIAPVSKIAELAFNDFREHMSNRGIAIQDDNGLFSDFMEFLGKYDGLPAYSFYDRVAWRGTYYNYTHYGQVRVRIADLSHEKNLATLGDYVDYTSVGYKYINMDEVSIGFASYQVDGVWLYAYPVRVSKLFPDSFLVQESEGAAAMYCVGLNYVKDYADLPYDIGYFYEQGVYGNVNATIIDNDGYGNISTYVYNTSTSLYCGIDQPIKCSYTGHVLAGNSLKSIHATYTGDGIFFTFANNGNEAVFVAASERQNDMVTVKVEKKVNGVTEQNENYIWLTREYTYDGRTVYYTYSGFPTSYGTIQKVVPSTTSEQINLFKTYHERIAWAIVYGNKPCGKNKMKLPVKWKRPGDRKILETTFEIEIKLPI